MYQFHYWEFAGTVAKRGGNFNNGGNAGVFALNLNNTRTNSNNNIGFRAALRLLNASNAVNLRIADFQ